MNPTTTEEILTELSDMEEWLENNVTVKTHRAVMDFIENIRSALKESEGK